jgi:hypothetical protein
MPAERQVKIIIKIHRDEIWEGLYLPFYLLFKKSSWRWEAVGAGLTLGGGVLSPLGGAILDLLVSYTRLGFERAALNRVSTFLYIITVPLLLLGSHFLDLLEKKALESRYREVAPPEPAIGQFGIQMRAEDC